MKRRHPNYRLVKCRRNYTVEETARLFGIHKNTVRNWLSHGLPAITDQRPILILGEDLIHFLKLKRKKNRQPLQPGEMYCLKCRIPVRPAGGIAEIIDDQETSANLRGICPSCESLIHRRVSLARFDAVIGNLEVMPRPAEQHIRGRTELSLHCDFVTGA